MLVLVSEAVFLYPTCRWNKYKNREIRSMLEWKKWCTAQVILGIHSAAFKILHMEHNQINTISQSYSKLSCLRYLVWQIETRTGASHCGGTKKNVGGWLQIVILRYLVSCCRFMNQKSGQAKIPRSRWDISALSFSSHSGSTAATRLFFLLHSVSFLTFHLFGPSLPSWTAITPGLQRGPNWFGYSLSVFKNTKYFLTFMHKSLQLTVLCHYKNDVWPYKYL